MKYAVRSRGFTLTEILIVISILLLILVLVLVNLQTQLQRARDAQRKTDLQKIQKSFEEYFNDKQCYPYEQILDDCGSNSLDPYQKRVPCDPSSRLPYLYVPGAPTLCAGYRICAKLEYAKDPDITRIGCDPVNGCGWSPGYNYCLSAGFDVARTLENADTAGPIGGPSSTPTPTPPPGQYACTPGGSCNNYANPTCSGPGAGCCPVTYADSGCVYLGTFQCGTPSNRCAN